jgi:curli biogenesis system outer membrane secretion channel CsgG
MSWRAWALVWWCCFSAVAARADAPLAISVWPFDSHWIGASAPPGEQQLLQEVLPDLLGQTLMTSTRIRLVERQQLEQVLQEQKLGSSALADEQTRLRLGRLVGARWMVFGSLVRIGEVWQMDVRIVDVERAQVVITASEMGSQSDYLPALQRIGEQILKQVN